MSIIMLVIGAILVGVVCWVGVLVYRCVHIFVHAYIAVCEDYKEEEEHYVEVTRKTDTTTSCYSCGNQDLDCLCNEISSPFCESCGADMISDPCECAPYCSECNDTLDSCECYPSLEDVDEDWSYLDDECDDCGLPVVQCGCYLSEEVPSSTNTIRNMMKTAKSMQELMDIKEVMSEEERDGLFGQELGLRIAHRAISRILELDDDLRDYTLTELDKVV